MYRVEKTVVHIHDSIAITFNLMISYALPLAYVMDVWDVVPSSAMRIRVGSALLLESPKLHLPIMLQRPQCLFPFFESGLSHQRGVVRLCTVRP